MRAILTLILTLALVSSACRVDARTVDDGSLTVVASSYPLAEAARRIGGDAVVVTELTPPGVEPHDLELTPDDIEMIATADVVLYQGGGFQPAVEDAVGEASGLVVDVSAGIATLPAPPDDHEGDHAEDEPEGDEALAADPHVWLDPSRYASMAEEIGRALDSVDGGSRFSDAVGPFADDLAALDDAFRAGLAACESRLLVVNHAAFGYLADAYDLEQEAISGVSPEAEPDPQRLAELRDLVVSEGVTTIFVESLVSPAVGEALAEEAGVTTAVLNPVEGLTQEQLDSGEDYGSIMRANLEALRDGLGCD